MTFLAGAGAQAAWNAGYYASFALCCLLTVWAAAALLTGRRGEGERESASDRRWAAALLEREREARSLAAFLDHAPVPLLAMRSRGGLSALNLAARRFFGTDDLVADAPEPLLSAALGARPGERRTLTLETEGSPRAYALTLSELVSDGDIVRIVALVDIQAEIQAAEAAALRELIQVLSHEIMNSLTPVTSLAQTTAELLRAPESAGSLAQAREAAETVARRSDGLLRFVGAYRELARLPEPRFADVGVAALLDEVALLFRSRWGPRGVTLELHKPAPEVAASLDPDLISQALLNVLANGAEAALETAENPTVRLHAEQRRFGRLSISIEDNGPGISFPDPSVIFRPFYTTKATGTGVGLSLARQIVLAHGGEISVRSALGSGTNIALQI
jgi:signal transduction histidine kinase